MKNVRLFALVTFAALQLGSVVASADVVANSKWWVCRYQGKSGSTYIGSDEVREKAFNQAYSQCQNSGDTPCKSAGCDSSNAFDLISDLNTQEN